MAPSARSRTSASPNRPGRVQGKRATERQTAIDLDVTVNDVRLPEDEEDSSQRTGTRVE
ncbi:hypothetical protein [Streptomyces sviceus]|uniref:hypothetical protein n=1 Tax=Streptomyces sviceus TaxID=285530 RepID=UPI0036A5A6C5